MAFDPSRLSRDRTHGVHPDLVRAVERVLRTMTQDFRVQEGLRTRGAMSPIPQRPIDAFRISHVQRSDGWIAITWNTMSSPAAFAVAGTEEQEGGEPPPLAGAGVVVCLMA